MKPRRQPNKDQKAAFITVETNRSRHRRERCTRSSHIEGDQMQQRSDIRPKYSSVYWRKLADDARARADEMVSSKVQLWTLEIARIYDQLADHEAKVEGRPKGTNPLRT